MHAFIYDALLSLVLVHAQVSAISGPPPPSSTTTTPPQNGSPLVKTVLSALIEELANQCLEAFGSVERFGMGGMLQVCLSKF